MLQQKKFGTLAGVYTPSLLTILGVIMYMRLGWVVGTSGLYYAIAIIVISHIISISTGLSISSIATDKQIKTGGIYYMLSRSLGLPMGGTIGITIFIATATSISLYIIGFCENFLGIPAISDFIGMSNTTANYSILGTFIIICLAALAFISTSLAIKTQFIVLGAIALSIISIIAGFIFKTEPSTSVPNLLPAVNALPLEVVFAIFFPAVTGFTAGVAMSGDLRDPKKSIPKGTLYSILTGLIVYIGLAICIAFFVDRDTLLNNKNFLMTVAYSAPLVVAGIWGATLSSALGGILGGPRIIQAISIDKIIPGISKILAKGHGKNNEPRNALILTFLIAEIGILIGDLDAIARIVSIFYLMAYGFINLSYALESWASTDFRPSFRIPGTIGIIGFIACFSVMFKLDLLAMIGALIVMFLLYILLKKKEMQLDFGDVWQSVWSSVIRTSLYKMDKKQLEERNWRPNIVLFSSEKETRSNLIELGKQFVGKHGLLSNFDLIEDKNSDIIIPRSKKSIDKDNIENTTGIFSRTQSCKNIFQGIEIIASTYGFSGVEPNTCILEWNMQKQKPVEFMETILTLNELDYNILMVDYDKNRGYGKREQIDIWWRGSSNNGNFALSLVKFLLLSEEWRNSNLRLLIINPYNDEAQEIHTNAKKILESLRINAEVKIINNQIEQKSFDEIIRVESINSDLIFLGLSNVVRGNEQKYVERISQLTKDIGTVVLFKASSYFKDLNIGTNKRILMKEDKTIDPTLNNSEMHTIHINNISPKPPLSSAINDLINGFESINKEIHNKYLNPIIQKNSNLINSIKEIVVQDIIQINNKKNHSKKELVTLISESTIHILKKSQDAINNYKSEIIPIQKKSLLAANHFLIEETNNIIKQQPQYLYYQLEKEDLCDKNDTDSIDTKWFLFRKRMQYKISSKLPKCKINYKNLLELYFPHSSYTFSSELYNQYGIKSMELVVKMQYHLNKIRESYLECLVNISKEKPEEHTKSLNELLAMLEEIESFNHSITSDSSGLLTDQFTSVLQRINSDIQEYSINSIIEEKENPSKTNIRKQIRAVESNATTWENNQLLLSNSVILESFLLLQRNILRKSLLSLSNDINDYIFTKTLAPLSSVSDKLFNDNTSINNLTEFNKLEKSIETVKRSDIKKIYNKSFRFVENFIDNFPEDIDIINNESLNNYLVIHLKENGIKSDNLSSRRLINYICQEEIITPIKNTINELSDNINLSLSGIKDALRLIDFSAQQNNKNINEDNSINKKEIQLLLDNETKKVREFILNIDEQKSIFSKQIHERLNAAHDKISYHSFTGIAHNMNQYIKEHEAKKVYSAFYIFIKKYNSIYKDQLIKLWYRHGSSDLFSKKKSTTCIQPNSQVDNLLNLSQSISPSKEITDSLPFYYKQLFSKHHYYNEFWRGRENELKKARKAFERFNTGIGGGILVLGENNVGKSFFVQHFSTTISEKRNTYTLIPPESGTTTPSVFHAIMERESKISGDIESIFQKLPKKSIIIIENLELWWEKSAKGLDVIYQIMELIDRYGDQFLFIVTANIHSYYFINKLHKIDSYFLTSIQLEPFKAEELQEIILARHKSSGIKLKMRDGNKTRDRFSTYDYARIFTKHYNFSNGNIGTCLNNWIACITEFDNDTIYIKHPKNPELSYLDNLETEWYLIILQFILHKNLSNNRLGRIFLHPPEIIQKKINTLKRAGVVVEDADGILNLNQYLLPFFREKLREKEML